MINLKYKRVKLCQKYMVLQKGQYKIIYAQYTTLNCSRII